jgi:hypothetical protein
MGTSRRNVDFETMRRCAGLVFFALGASASIYYVYDLRYPNRFVGDMYGLEVMFRLVPLCFFAGAMLLGGVILSVGRWKSRRRLRIVATAIIFVSSTILTAMAFDVVQDRRLNEVRKHYPEKSVEELLAIARVRKDQHAIDAIMIKADPAAVPGLALILLNENEPGNLRYAAAQALARIGGDDALKALAKAWDSVKDEHFRKFLADMIEHVRSGR